MDSVWIYALVALTCLGGSLLTFFSGFGLGTLLMPVFALFFPLDQAVALTAVVHLGNNLFKAGIIGGHIAWPVALRFGVPALVGAWLGAQVLLTLGGSSLLGPVLGALLIAFALFEVIPALKNLTVSARWLIPGGLLSGFFGGLSGHQGALRTVFLVRSGLGKEAFIATGVAIALAVDVSRLSIYQNKLLTAGMQWDVVITGLVAALGGAVLGKRWLKKTTMEGLQRLVAIALVLFGIYLIFWS